jgi:hypothetical protein
METEQAATSPSLGLIVVILGASGWPRCALWLYTTEASKDVPASVGRSDRSAQGWGCKRCRTASRNHRIARRPPRQDLQGHAATHRGLLGLVDHAHAAPTEFAQDLIAGDRPVIAVTPGPALPEELVIVSK